MTLRHLDTPVRRHLLVAAIAALWGTLARLALDWLLPLLGFGRGASTPMLSFAIGPLPVWAVISVAAWTPMTNSLRTATRRGSLVIGCVVVGVGMALLYPFFVVQMGPPTSLEGFITALLFFPLFVVTALGIGGFVAVPVTLVTAVLLRGLLQWRDPPSSTSSGSAV